jgi:5-methylcytosine-specific restriction endonuclease McrA
VNDRCRRLRSVIRRDGLACWICGRPVDLALPCDTDDRAASLDHVIPQASSGGHELGNLRLAHKRCNQVRGSAFELLKNGHLLLDVEAQRTLAVVLRRFVNP